MTLTSRRSLIILAVSCFFLFFLGMSSFGITDPGEGYYVEAAREMVESGDFITPHLNYQIYFSKPILTFWLIAIPYEIFGVNEFSARIAFSFVATLLVYATYRAGRALGSEFAGLLAGLAIATSPLIVMSTRLSPIDIAFSCFIDIAVFSFAVTALLNRTRWWWVFYVSLALAVLTKGPAAIILFLFGTVVFLGLARTNMDHLKACCKRLKLLPGITLFLVLTLPWYLAIGIVTKGLFLRVFLFYENLARFAGHTNLGRDRFWHYLPVIGYGFAPWIAVLPFSLFSIARSRPKVKAAFDAEDSESPEEKNLYLFYLMVWALSEFLFFSLSKTKLDTYILPALAPFAVCFAIQVDAWFKALQDTEASQKMRAKAAVAFNFVGILGILVLVVAPVTAFLKLPIDLTGKLAFVAGFTILALGLIFCWRLNKEGKPQAGVIAFATALAIGGGLCQPIMFQIGSRDRWDDLKVIASHLRGKDVDLAIFSTFKPAVMFYAQNSVDTFFHPYLLQRVYTREKLRPLLIISHDKEVSSLLAQPGIKLKLVERSGAWAVYEAVRCKLTHNITLTEVFSDPHVFDMSVHGEGSFGPLTVPYSSGRRQWWKKQ